MTRVVKVGGRVQADPSLAARLAEAWRAGAGALCVVHGGGDEMTALQGRLGEAPTFVGGRRVTTPADVELLRMALSGAANKRLVAQLVAQGVPAVGISGEDAGLIGAAPIDRARLGEVGAPAAVQPDVLRHLLAGGYLPVVSPVSRDAGAAAPQALNVNADDAAAAIAAALGAAELLLVSDVSGVRDETGVRERLDADEAMALVRRGTAAGGMAPKLEAALAALGGGVDVVRVGNLSMLGAPTAGTSIVSSRSLV